MCAERTHQKKGTIRHSAEAPSRKGCRGDTPSTLERKLILSVSGAHTNSLRHRRSGLSSVFSSGSCDYSQVDHPAHAHGCTHVGVREVIGFRTRTSYGNRFDHKAVRRSARSSRLERSHWSMNTRRYDGGGVPVNPLVTTPPKPTMSDFSMGTRKIRRRVQSCACGPCTASSGSPVVVSTKLGRI